MLSKVKNTMLEFEVTLTSINHVKEFVTAASMMSCEIDVTSGRYTIDAKSIMGLFSLDLTKPITVQVRGTEAQGQEFRDAVKELVTRE